MYKILIKKGMEIEPTEHDNYPEFYAQLYRNIKKNLMVCLKVHQVSNKASVQNLLK